MKVTEIREIAQQHNIKPGKLSKTELIRAVQQAEGNSPCFGSNQAKNCGQEHCLWRSDCT